MSRPYGWMAWGIWGGTYVEVAGGGVLGDTEGEAGLALAPNELCR